MCPILCEWLDKVVWSISRVGLRKSHGVRIQRVRCNRFHYLQSRRVSQSNTIRSYYVLNLRFFKTCFHTRHWYASFEPQHVTQRLLPQNVDRIRRRAFSEYMLVIPCLRKDVRQKELAFCKEGIQYLLWNQSFQRDNASRKSDRMPLWQD